MQVALRDYDIQIWTMCADEKRWLVDLQGETSFSKHPYDLIYNY